MLVRLSYGWFFLGLVVALGLPLPIFAGTEDGPEAFIEHYYEQKQPDKIAGFLQNLDTQPAEDITLSSERLGGFLSGVFDENPTRVGKWLAGSHSYHDQTKSVLLEALTYAGLSAKAERYAKDEGLISDVDMRHLAERPLLTTPPPTSFYLDSHWGAFFATGNPVYLGHIISALTGALPSDKYTTNDLIAASQKDYTPELKDKMRALLRSPDEMARFLLGAAALKSLLFYAPAHPVVRTYGENARASMKDAELSSYLKKELETKEAVKP
jgi:hypothetical protein